MRRVATATGCEPTAQVFGDTALRGVRRGSAGTWLSGVASWTVWAWPVQLGRWAVGVGLLAAGTIVVSTGTHTQTYMPHNVMMEECTALAAHTIPFHHTATCSGNVVFNTAPKSRSASTEARPSGQVARVRRDSCASAPPAIILQDCDLRLQVGAGVFQLPLRRAQVQVRADAVGRVLHHHLGGEPTSTLRRGDGQNCRAGGPVEAAFGRETQVTRRLQEGCSPCVPGTYPRLSRRTPKLTNVW